MQRGCASGKKAPAQITAEQVQRQRGQCSTQGNPQRAAHCAQRSRLPQHQPHALGAGEAQHPQQGELLGAARHAQGQYRKHQKAAREQGHQGQHRQVDAVGARQLAHALRRVARRCQRRTGRPVWACLQGTRPCVAVHTTAQAHIDPADLCLAAKQVLHRCNVHDRQRRSCSLHAARHAHRLELQALLQLQRAIAQRAARRRVEKHRIGCEQVQAPRLGIRPGHQVRRNRRHLQGIHTDDAQQGAPRGRVAAQCVGAEFEHRRGKDHIRVVPQACQHGRRRWRSVRRLLRRVEAQFQIRLPTHRAHRLRELVQRRCVDQVHRKRQGHPQHDRHHGRRVAPRVVAQFLPGKAGEKGPQGTMHG